MLVVFRGDVGLDGVGEVDGVGAAEGDLEDVAALHLDDLLATVFKIEDGVFSNANKDPSESVYIRRGIQAESGGVWRWLHSPLSRRPFSPSG